VTVFIYSNFCSLNQPKLNEVIPHLGRMDLTDGLAIYDRDLIVLSIGFNPADVTTSHAFWPPTSHGQ